MVLLQCIFIWQHKYTIQNRAILCTAVLFSVVKDFVDNLLLCWALLRVIIFPQNKICLWDKLHLLWLNLTSQPQSIFIFISCTKKTHYHFSIHEATSETHIISKQNKCGYSYCKLHTCFILTICIYLYTRNDYSYGQEICKFPSLYIGFIITCADTFSL